MKISSVDIIQVPGGNAGASRGDWSPVVVRINADEGISGFGEVGLAYGKGWRGGAGMTHDLAELVIGEDPLDIERLWEHVFRASFWGLGGGTVVSAAMSGLDVALWDIKGKALGVPVWQLLGGRTNDELRAYASQLQYNWGEDLATSGRPQALSRPEEYAEVTRRVVAEGYDCIKVDPIVIAPEHAGAWRTTGPLSRQVVDTAYRRVAAIREAGGPDLDIILEHHALTDTTAAIQIGRALDDLRVFYFEEPCHPLNATSMLEVKRNVAMPIAAGERIYTRYGFRPFLESRSIDVVQPDVCLCGGISEAKKICDMAYVYDCTVQLHVCGGPIATAAALQVEATIPHFLVHEHHQRAVDPAGRATCRYDLQPTAGRFQIPDEPGIGQELTPDALSRSTITTVDRGKRYL